MYLHTAFLLMLRGCVCVVLVLPRVFSFSVRRICDLRNKQTQTNGDGWVGGGSTKARLAAVWAREFPFWFWVWFQAWCAATN